MNQLTLRELHLEELMDMYGAENQLLSALPQMKETTGSQAERQEIQDRIEQTELHVKRLGQFLGELGVKLVDCEAGKEILETQIRRRNYRSHLNISPTVRRSFRTA